MGNVLDLHDQTKFDFGRVTGVTSQLQCVWVYNRPVELDGLRQFHEHLRHGRLRRGIERSPLRFGRHRWISSGGSSDLEIVATARPREEFHVWLSEQASIPVDCECGPGWRLAVVPFTDGGTGVSLVVSHCLIDGVGLCEAIVDAVFGRDDPISWPAAGSRRRWQALREDASQTVRDTSAMCRGAAAAVRLARRSRGGAGAATPRPALPAGADDFVTLPTATIFVDAHEWEARARSLGGTSNALLVGVAARLAQRAGWASADGSVTLTMPVNERVAGDTRANANFVVAVTVDPSLATTNLREIRAAVKQVLIRHQEVRDDERAVMSIVPLVGLVPQRLIRKASRGGDGSSVIASNLGVVDPAASRPDGTDADRFAMKILYSGVTEAVMHQSGGLQVLLSGTAHGQFFFSIVAYQPLGLNSYDALRQDVSSVLDDFSLTGTYL